jgi:hypothetical protein
MTPSPRAPGWPACREERRLWDMQVACKELVDAASCDANAAKHNCSWVGEPAYCRAAVGYTCDGGPQTASCKILTARLDAITKCGKATTKAACAADEACRWAASAASCTASPYGLSLANRKAGSKVEEAHYTEDKACNTLTTKQACLDEPLPAGTPGRASVDSPSPSPPQSTPPTPTLGLTPAPAPSPAPAPASSPAGKVPLAAIVAPTAAAGVALLAVAGAWFVVRRKNQNSGASKPVEPLAGAPSPDDAEDGTMVTIPALAASAGQGPMIVRI